MARVVGIKTENHPNGRIKSYIIDAKKHGEKLKPFLKDVGYTNQEEEQVNKILAEHTFLSVEESKKLTKKLFLEKCKNERLI